ncbi:MAG: maleylpyruvate isomerase N-terminal domain-containing protein [Nocardioides sp.]|uniref:maleylpyruvate isomerase N-terminal domain-containing protein n=1 Tax=Nocardioides sp. TaxID=35761 RepID=UPI0039E31CE4
MPTRLSLAQHLAALGTAMTAFVRYADRAGLDADVPTCPGWTVRDLIAHQGMVHRWATALVSGERPRVAQERSAAWQAEGLVAMDPLGWLRTGAVRLSHQLTQAAPDLEVLTFLADAPAPREFWARRQAHETTIHAVDAQAAALGRVPEPAEADWIGAEVAVDGIDELLGGFLPRPTSTLRSAEESLLVVRLPDVGESWEVEVGPHPPRTLRLGDGDRGRSADWELTGDAGEVYLRVWNRGAPPAMPTGDWRELTAVAWG